MFFSLWKFVAVFVLIGTIFVTSSHSNESLLFTHEILSAFNSTYPGRGIDHFEPEKDADYAMTYALFASASARIGDVARARTAADWLVRNSEQPNEKYGWPFPFALDDEDNTDRIYVPATGFGISALMDVYCLTGDPRYAEVARRVLDYYKNFIVEEGAGLFFRYSNDEKDCRYIPNASALLAGVYARAGFFFKNNQYENIASKAIKYLYQTRVVTRNGTFWLYSSEDRKKDNDLIHHCMILKGLLEYDVYGSEPLPDYFISRVFKFLNGFWEKDRLCDRHPQSYYRSKNARLWGVGMAIDVYSYNERKDKADKALRWLDKYKIDDGKYGFRPRIKKFYPRQQVFVALGVSQYESGIKMDQCRFEN